MEVTVCKMVYHGPKVNSDIQLENYHRSHFKAYRDMSCNSFRPVSVAVGLDPNDFYSEEELDQKSENLFLLTEKEVIIGAVEITDNEIQHIVVNTEFQRKGVGKKLLK